jgi:hypothetical protein
MLLSNNVFSFYGLSFGRLSGGVKSVCFVGTQDGSHPHTQVGVICQYVNMSICHVMCQSVVTCITTIDTILHHILTNYIYI